MIKAYRLRNALLNGAYNAGSFETFLGDQANKAIFQLLMSDPVWVSDIFAVQTSAEVLVGSTAARLALWESFSAIETLNKSRTAKGFLYSKATSKDISIGYSGSYLKGKNIIVAVKFNQAGGGTTIINQGGGSIGLSPIINLTAGEQLVIRGLDGFNHQNVGGTPAVTVALKYIQV